METQVLLALEALFSVITLKAFQIFPDTSSFQAYAWTLGPSNELDMGPALGELEVFRQKQRKQGSSVWRDVPRARGVQRHCIRGIREDTTEELPLEQSPKEEIGIGRWQGMNGA